MSGSEFLVKPFCGNQLLGVFASGMLFCCSASCTLSTKDPSPAKETPEVKVENPEVLEILPEASESAFQRDIELTLKFSLSIDPSTVTVNQEDTQCSGSVQISADGFQTCVRLEKPEASADRTEFKFAPQGIYKSKTRYQLRLTAQITTPEGGKLPENNASREFITYSTQQLGASGNDRGMGLVVDGDEQIYVSGMTSSGKGSEEIDVFLVKFAAEGRQIWIRQAGFQHYVESCSLDLKTGDRIRIIAHHPDQLLSRMLVAEYDAEGVQLWKRVYESNGPASGSAIAVDEKGNVYGAGSLKDPMLQIRASGEPGWNSSMNTSVQIQAIALDVGQHMYAAGNLEGGIDGQTNKGGLDAFLVRMHQSGIKRWSRQFGSSEDDTVTALLIGSLGVLVVIRSEILSDSILRQVSRLYKYAPDGEQIWEHSLADLLPGPVLGAYETEEEHLLLVGYTINAKKFQQAEGKTSLHEDAFAARLDAEGNLVWLQLFGGEGNERALAVTLSSSGTTYVTGYTTGTIDGSPNSGGEDVVLARFNSEGERF